MPWAGGVQFNTELFNERVIHLWEKNSNYRFNVQFSLLPERSQFDQKTEKLLVELYKEVEAKKALKNKWQIVCKRLNAYGYNFDNEQCRLKIKCLKDKQIRRNKKNNTSGESPAEDSDYEDSFNNFPDVKPKKAIDTHPKKKPVDDSPSIKPSTSSDSHTAEDSSDSQGTGSL